ncbi:MAG: hypothetical protein RLY43_1515, partial [Bacteroidota bacterium]
MEQLLIDIDEKEIFSLDETFDIYKKCSELIIQNENAAQKVVINILDN